MDDVKVIELEQSESGTGLVIGLTIGFITLLITSLTVTYCLCRRRKKLIKEQKAIVIEVSSKPKVI